MADKKMETITAHRDGQSREFTKEVWDALPDNKYGWKKKADEPDEVKNLKTSKPAETKSPTPEAETITGTGSEAEGGTAAGTSGDSPVTEKAADLAKKIYAAATVADVDSLVPDGEIRKTVLDAAAARKEQLAKAS